MYTAATKIYMDARGSKESSSGTELTRDRIGGVGELHLGCRALARLLIIDVDRKGSEDADGLVNKCGSQDQHAEKRPRLHDGSTEVGLISQGMNPMTSSSDTPIRFGVYLTNN
ncbi:hypothetical protein F5887DRAFT_919504 [Amanita rubescens]|nr:hypothetical protein F5887DRAFT_919504 [Amanita rubescens]